MSLVAAFALRMLGSNLFPRVSRLSGNETCWEEGTKESALGTMGREKSRNYIQFPIESNRKLKILKFS